MERNDFSNSESPFCPYTSHQVSAQSDFPLERRCRLNNFKIAAMGQLGYLNETTLAILNLHVVPIGFTCIRLSVFGKMSFKEFQDGRHLGYRNGINLAILNLHVAPISSTRFLLTLTFRSGGDVV